MSDTGTPTETNTDRTEATEETSERSTDEVSQPADAVESAGERSAETADSSVSADGSTVGPPQGPTRPALTAADRDALTVSAQDRVGPRLALPGVLVATAGFVIGAGPVGLFAGLITGVLWVIAPPMYAVAAGAGLLATLGIGALPAGAAALGLALVFCASLDQPAVQHPWWIITAAGVAGCVFGGILFVSFDAFSLPLAAGTLVGAAGIVLYTIHRLVLASIVYPSTDSSREHWVTNDEQSTGVTDE